MIARNYIRFPAALQAQRELELVICAAAALTREASDLIGRSIKANVAWVCEFVTAKARKTTPAWVKAAKKRARDLAWNVELACMDLFYKN